MKKTIITLAAIAAMTISANAQVFIGGTAGLNFNGGDTTVSSIKTDNPSTASFSIAPNVGYYFADNFLAGGRVSFSYNKAVTPGLLQDTKVYTYNWMIEPYARYRFLELNKFGVWSECNAYFGRKTGNTKVGSTKSDANPVCSWGINVLPVLTYTINDHLCLETSLNAFGFGYKGTYTKNSDKSYEANTSAVSFAANSTDIFGQLGLVNIGFTYKF